MKLAFFTLLKGRNWGGSENLWFKTAILALNNGHEVLVITDKALDARKLKTLQMQGAAIFYLENYLISYKERILQFFNPSFAKKKFRNNLNERIQQFDPHLMVINQPGCYDIAFDSTSSEFLKFTKKQYTICFHSYTNKEVLSDSRKALMRKILISASANFFVAKKQATTILQQLKLNLENIAFIFNPLNISNRSIIPYPPSENIKFAMVSSLDMKWKGHDIVLNILSKPEWRHRNWSLSIFGEGPDLEKIKAFIANYDLANRVELKGYATDIRQIWTAHHILLMPSRVDAAPAVLLEAMACGRTAVCTNIGFTESWIEDGINGFIAEINSYEQAFLKAWDERHKWENMGKIAHDKLNVDFPEKPEKEFLEQLTALVQNKNEHL